MTIGPYVFGDDRLGLWIVNPANLTDRLPKIAGALAGTITDLFLPPTATAADRTKVLAFGNGRFRGCLMYAVARESITPENFAVEVLSDTARIGAGAADLNVELDGDPARISDYCRRTVARIRQSRPSFRLRLNLAWRKGVAVPVDLVAADPNLYVVEQDYAMTFGDMTPTSSADALDDLIAAGVPRAKAAVCYGAAGPVFPPPAPRVVTLGVGWRLRRGVIFQDDLMAEVGLL